MTNAEKVERIEQIKQLLLTNELWFQSGDISPESYHTQKQDLEIEYSMLINELNI